MDDPVAVAAGPDAGDGFVDLRSRREAGGDLRDAGSVVRMDAEQHVVGELAVRPLPVLIAEQLAEAVGEDERNGPPVDELTDGKRRPHALQRGALFR